MWCKGTNLKHVVLWCGWDPFTCPQPSKHMAGWPFPSPLHLSPSRTAALAPTDHSAISPFRELKQPTAHYRKVKIASGWGGWAPWLTVPVSTEARDRGDWTCQQFDGAEPYPKAFPPSVTLQQLDHSKSRSASQRAEPGAHSQMCGHRPAVGQLKLL